MIANKAETKMMAGRIWKAKMTPSVEFGFPSSPNTKLEPT